jgi:hypothetical protein
MTMENTERRNNPPRDPSEMGSNNNSGMYTGIGLVALIVIGFLVFATYEPVQNLPTQSAPAPVTQPQ